LLYSPDHHERLSDRPWDEGWVRERIERIADDAESAVGADGLWPEHPDDHDDDSALPRTVYMGAAGIVWGLHALGRDRPDLIGGLYEGYLREPDWPGLSPGYWPGEAGILLVQELVEPGSADLDALESAIRRNAGNESNEQMWGAPGTMIVALAMHRRHGGERWLALWRESANELWSRWRPDEEVGDRFWTQLLYGQTARYVGPGHGFAGNVLALWQGRELLEPGHVAELAQRVPSVAAALAVRDDGRANWPPLVEGGLEHNNRIRTQWCHGAPGMVASLADIAAEDDELTSLLVAGGELVWRAGPLRYGQGLCHGTAGNGLALLALHARTGDQRWLERARAFGVHALEQVERERTRHGIGRYSLWTGDIGAAVMAQSCIEARPGMPTLDWV
jgi:hypothetical protein